MSLGRLDHIVGFHLRRASAAFAADFHRVLEGTGMRQVSFAVLAMIADHPEVHQGLIGRALGIQRANMVALIGDLLARGLIERVVANEDRRAFALRLAPRGKALLDDCQARIDAHEDRLLQGFDVRERALLIALLNRIGGRYT